MENTFRVILEANELGGYTVTVPALPGCVTQGSNRAEALQRAQEAILCHLEGLLGDGLALPEDCLRDGRGDVAQGLSPAQPEADLKASP